MLKYPHDVLKVSPFSRGFAESPLLKFYIQFVGWVFVLLIIGVWSDAFIQWQLL